YNNGAINRKDAIYGESYTSDGKPAKLLPTSRPTTQQVQQRGMLAALWPLPRWEISQPGNILRVFERGGRFRPSVGVPQTLEDPGKPDPKLSVRGDGTDARTDLGLLALPNSGLPEPRLTSF